MRAAAARSDAGRRVFWVALAVAVAGLAVTAVLLSIMLWPPLDSALRTEVADGSRAFAMTGGSGADARATVTPGTGWTVQPDGDGVLVRSPDRQLAIALTVEPLADAEEALTSPSEPGTVLSEQFGSGAELQHVTRGDRFVGVLSSGADAVLIEARTDPPAELADYRTALAELLETVEGP